MHINPNKKILSKLNTDGFFNGDMIYFCPCGWQSTKPGIAMYNQCPDCGAEHQLRVTLVDQELIDLCTDYSAKEKELKTKIESYFPQAEIIHTSQVINQLEGFGLLKVKNTNTSAKSSSIWSWNIAHDFTDLRTCIDACYFEVELLRFLKPANKIYWRKLPYIGRVAGFCIDTQHYVIKARFTLEWST